MPVAPLVSAEEADGPRGPYRKSQKTKARILAAALEVFGEVGFDNGSIREIAERAEISQAGLLHHYPSKVALLSAILERRDEEALAHSNAADSGVARLAAMVEFARLSETKPAEVALFTVLSAEATRADHPANEYFKRRYTWTSDIMEESFRELHEQGLLRPELRPDVATSMFMAVWDGVQLQWLLGHKPISVAERLRQYLDSILVGPLDSLVAREAA